MKSYTNYILFDENSIYYECGYSNDNSVFLRLGRESFFFTDSRYLLEAKLALDKNINLIITKELAKEIKKTIKKSKINSIVLDPNEITLNFYNQIFSKLKIKVIEKINFSKLKRIIKNDSEIKLIKKASNIAKKGFKKFEEYLFSKGFEKSEIELAFVLKKYITKKEKYNLSFEPIVAVNQNAALPHAKPSKTKFKKNDLILIDAGIKYKRYCSDRTVTLGNKSSDFYQREQKFNKKLYQKVYDIVYSAQQKAIEAVKPGIKASKIDKIAREYIDKKGFGKYFVHSTGHGVGLDIHELPIISAKSNEIIKENMVFTIEPGIYLPNKFGVRIEDKVVVTKNSFEIL